ncbi:hypothetical protein THOM_2697 [Trachipleistophora hominis]|uniref:Uncharacterized protein n=1 Tax=Trachipleistophora hominis TaxID=72359 RepID=L7JSJ3_TRAHO|nr:hypothetical protein THOM_2697 [Trachipleistophora hominis]
MPRVNVSFGMYISNRWAYKTECIIFSSSLYLLIPSYFKERKRFYCMHHNRINPNKQSRRQIIVYQDYFNGILKGLHSNITLHNVAIHWSIKNANRMCQVDVNTENVDHDKIDIDFKCKHVV